MLVNELIKNLEEILELQDIASMSARDIWILAGKAQAYKDCYALITGRRFDWDYELDSENKTYNRIQ